MEKATLKIGIGKNQDKKSFEKVWQAFFDKDGVLIAPSFHFTGEDTHEFLKGCVKREFVAATKNNKDRPFTILQDQQSGLFVEGTMVWKKKEKEIDPCVCDLADLADFK